MKNLLHTTSILKKVALLVGVAIFWTYVDHIANEHQHAEQECSLKMHECGSLDLDTPYPETELVLKPKASTMPLTENSFFETRFFTTVLTLNNSERGPPYFV